MSNLAIPDFQFNYIKYAAHAFSEEKVQEGKKIFHLVCGGNERVEKGVYYWMWKLKGCPSDIPDYGKWCFHDQDGFSSTATEKANAIYHYLITQNQNPTFSSHFLSLFSKNIVLPSSESKVDDLRFDSLRTAAYLFSKEKVKDGEKIFSRISEQDPSTELSVYYWMWKLKGSPSEAPDYGRSCFHSENGLSSTSAEKASAIHHYLISKNQNPFIVPGSVFNQKLEDSYLLLSRAKVHNQSLIK